MNAIEFVTNYLEMLDDISPVLTPEALSRLRSLDPHELVGLEAYFAGRTHAIGFIVTVAFKK